MKDAKSIATINIKLDVIGGGTALTIFSPNVTESICHIGIAPLAVAELVKEWLSIVEADIGREMPTDPLIDSEIRSAQWNALRQGRTLSYEIAKANISKIRKMP